MGAAMDTNNATNRQPLGFNLGEVRIRATSAETAPGFAIVYETGYGRSGIYSVYFSPDEARAAAAALIACADHYDAETARVAAAAQQVSA